MPKTFSIRAPIENMFCSISDLPDTISNSSTEDDNSTETVYTTLTPAASTSPDLSDINIDGDNIVIDGGDINIDGDDNAIDGGDIAIDGDDISIDDDFSLIKVEDDFLLSAIGSSPVDRSDMVHTPDLFLGLLDDERYKLSQSSWIVVLYFFL